MIEEFLFNYCPWVNRVRIILRWLVAIMQDQVDPGGLHKFLYNPISLWPGWDWAQMNAIYSSRTSPWHSSWVFSVYNGIHAADDDDAPPNYCIECGEPIPEDDVWCHFCQNNIED